MVRQGSKVFSLILVLAMLVACGVNTSPQGGATGSGSGTASPSGSTGASASPSGSASTAASGSPSGSAQASGGNATTIRWRTRVSDAAEQTVYQDLNTQANEALASQGITAQYDPGVNQDYFPKLKTELAAGTAPDIFWIGSVELADFVNLGTVLDIKPFIDKDTSFNIGEFNESTIKELSRDGKIYGLPRDISTMVVYYNEDLFRQANLPTPKELSEQGNWTWDTMLDTAKKLTDPSKQQYGAGWGNWWGPGWGWFVNAAGGSPLNADRTACALNTPEAIEGARFAQQFYTEGLRPAGDDSAVESAFNAGKLAMMWSGRWTTPGVRQNATTFTFDVAEMPQGKVKSTWLFWGPYLVNAKTENPEAAWEVLKQITSADAMARVSGEGTNIPARTNQEAVNVFLQSTPPTNNQAFISGTEYAAPEAPVWDGNWADFSSAVQSQWDQMIAGTITPEQFGQQACEQTASTFE